MVVVYVNLTANQNLHANTILTGLPVPTKTQKLFCSNIDASIEIRLNASDGIVVTNIKTGNVCSVFGCYVK